MVEHDVPASRRADHTNFRWQASAIQQVLSVRRPIPWFGAVVAHLLRHRSTPREDVDLLFLTVLQRVSHSAAIASDFWPDLGKRADSQRLLPAAFQVHEPYVPVHSRPDVVGHGLSIS